MKTSQTRFSLLRNKLLPVLLLCLSINACSGSKAGREVLPAPYAAQAGQGLVYNASFYYKDFNASGLLVIKRLSEADYHLVLLSKFGVSLMEFKLSEDGIQWIKSFEQLQDKKIEKMLERDFRVLLLTALEDPVQVKLLKENKEGMLYSVKGGMRIRLLLAPESRQVVYAENRSFLNPVKTKVAFFYNQHPVPDSMALRHSNINMGLDLKLLKIINAEK